MTIVEYTLTDEGRIPDFVTDGGHWWSHDNKTLIAAMSDDNVPDGVETYTLEELQARQRAIQAKYPMRVDDMDNDSDIMTDNQVNTMIEDWVDARS